MATVWFWLGATVLTLACLLPMLRVLLRPTAPGAAGTDFSDAIYRAQLAELERDLARGVLERAQYDSARAEVGRRLLAAQRESGGDSGLSVRRSPRVATGLALLLPAGAVATYLALGSLEAMTVPTHLADSTAGERQHMEQSAASLAQKLAANPNDLDGWRLLARTYGMLRNHGAEAEAYARAVALAPEDPALLGGQAEALTNAAGGIVTPQALGLFGQALERDPTDPRARYFLALARQQAGDLRGALARWQDLMKDSPADAPWVPHVRQDITNVARQLNLDPATVVPEPLGAVAQAAPPPSAAPQPAPGAVAPALSPEQMRDVMALPEAERKQVIEGMVGRLAARLEENPNDPAGWRRLAQAYRVLGQEEKAREAEANAIRNAVPTVPAAPAPQAAPPPAAPPAQAAARPLSQEEVQAAEAMAPEQQQAMVEQMVAGLAERLKKEPGDADGWLRLGRAYTVLGRKAEARDAFAKAAAAAPERADVLLADAMAAMPEDGSRPGPAFFSQLSKVLALDPQNQAALWYLGLGAASDGRKAEAEALWRRLLSQFPEGSPDHTDLKKRIEALKGP